jgi:hypothetical protein
MLLAGASKIGQSSSDRSTVTGEGGLLVVPLVTVIVSTPLWVPSAAVSSFAATVTLIPVFQLEASSVIVAGPGVPSCVSGERVKVTGAAGALDSLTVKVAGSLPAFSEVCRLASAMTTSGTGGGTAWQVSPDR